MICLNFIRLYLLMAINDLIIIIIIIINEISLNYLYKKIQKFIIRKINNNNNTICIVIINIVYISKSITVKCKRDKSCKSLISVTTKAAKCCCVSFTSKAARFHADHAFTLLVQNTGLRKQYQDRIGRKCLFTNTINAYQLFIINHPVWLFLTCWVNVSVHQKRSWFETVACLFRSVLLIKTVFFISLSNLKETKTDSYHLWYFILQITTNQDFM